LAREILGLTGEYEGGFRSFTDVLTSAIEIAEAAYKRDGKLVGTATGFADLDNLLGGLQRSDLVILAGRPSKGEPLIDEEAEETTAGYEEMIEDEDQDSEAETATEAGADGAASTDGCSGRRRPTSRAREMN